MNQLPSLSSRRMPLPPVTPFMSGRLYPNKAVPKQIYPPPAPMTQPVNTGFQSMRTGPVNYKTFFGMYRRKHPRTSANKIAKKYELAMSLMGF